MNKPAQFFKSKAFYGSLILIALAITCRFVIAPHLTKIPNNFTFEADINSIDNFYNAETQQYLGEQRSVTQFSYNVESIKNGILNIKNTFDVRTVQGDPIFSVERTYGINPKTTMHTPAHGDKDRNGYLFAPKNLKYEQPFTYWHINYDGPAQMQFVEKENLFGLTVYKYETNYEGVTIDQTEQLTNLPNVGETLGIILEPTLELWVEPVTGRLIKYKDQTTAYYYSLETGEKLYPWNKFSNTITQRSVKNIVEQVKITKIVFVLVQQIIPLLLLSAAGCLLISKFNKKTAILLFITLFFSLAALFTKANISTAPVNKVKIGIIAWVDSAGTDDSIESYKKTLIDSGYTAQNSIVYERLANNDIQKLEEIINEYKQMQIDVFHVITTPAALKAKELVTDIPVVFSVVTYPVETGLIKSLKNSGNNIVGVRSLIQPDIQLKFITDVIPNINKVMIVRNVNEPNSIIQFEQWQQLANDKFEILDVDVVDIQQLKTELENYSGETPDFIYAPCDTLVLSNDGWNIINNFAILNNLPVISCSSARVVDGAILGFSSDFEETGKLAAEKTQLILDGLHPSSIESSVVGNSFLFLNQTKANELGIFIPPATKSRAIEIF